MEAWRWPSTSARKNTHPLAKQLVGERFARLALADVYGPAFQTLGKKWERHHCNIPDIGNNRARRGSSFQCLEARDGKPEVPRFEVEGKDGEFHSAAAWIISKTRLNGSVPQLKARSRSAVLGSIGRSHRWPCGTASVCLPSHLKREPLEGDKT